MKQTRIILLLISVMSLATTSANAYDALINGIYYNLYGGYNTAEVVMGNPYEDRPYEQVEENYYHGDIVIPEKVKYNGITYTVTTIGKWAFFNSKLNSVTIPHSIKKIESNAFEWCNSLSAVYISDLEAWCNIEFAKDIDSEYHISEFEGNNSNPLTIAGNLYLGGIRITDLIIPASVKEIGFSQFSGINVNSVVIPSSITSIGDYAFFKGNVGKVEVPESIKRLGDFSFAWCTLSSINLPESIAIYGIATFSNASLTSISLPKNMKSIPNRMFEGSMLQSIDIPEGMKQIGEMSFASCQYLKKVNIPTTVDSIGYYAFAGCSAQIHVKDLAAWYEIGFWDSFYEATYSLWVNGEETVNLVIPSEIKHIKNGTFQGCASIRSVKIHDDVNSIGSSSFYGCKNLQTVSIGNGVPAIGSSAFSDCASLSNVEIGENVATIGVSAFQRCVELSSITMPESVTRIESYAFEGCTKLTTVNLPNDIQFVGTGAFYDTAWYWNQDNGLMYLGNVAYKYKGVMPDSTTINIKDGTVAIAEGAFKGYRNLVSVIMPNSLESIGLNAFEGCSGLTSVSIPGKVATIGANAFSKCESLSNVNLEPGVTEIGIYAFNNCTSLTSINIPGSVTKIGNNAFNGCGLTEVKISEGVSSIGSRTFAYCNNLSLAEFPNSIVFVGMDAFYKTAWLDSQPDGLIYIGSVAYKYKGEMPDNTSIEIKEGTKAISGAAFNGCVGMTSIHIPSSIISIGSSFSDCKKLSAVHITDLKAWCNIEFEGNPLQAAHHLYLNGEEIKNLIIPEGISSIGKYSFAGGSGFTSVSMPSGITSIGERAFFNCSGLANIQFSEKLTNIEPYAFCGCNSLESLSLPNGLQSISFEAFKNCSGLKTISIPKTVTEISSWAFSRCTSLESVISLIESPFEIYETVFSVESEPSLVFTTAKLYVPKGTKEKYETTKGWNKFEQIIEIIPTGDKCATPTIAYEQGDLVFSCETEGAQFVSEIKVADAKKSNEARVTLMSTYEITVYATADGYADSDVATATIGWRNSAPVMEGFSNINLGKADNSCDVNGDGTVDVADIAAIISEMAARARKQK